MVEALALAVADHAAPSPAEALYSQDFRFDELDFRLYESVLTRDQMGDR